jgi:hypothetical protein
MNPALPRARSIPFLAGGGTMGWWGVLGVAASTVWRRPALAAVGLLGFLARGGLVAFLVPIAALPTPIGIANFIGGTALTGSGASDGLVRLIATAVVVVVVVVALGAVLGAIADALLAREAVAAAAIAQAGLITDHARGRTVEAAVAKTPVTATLVGSLLVVRGVTLLPVGFALAWASTRLYAAGYHQLILPDDLAVPLVVRILREASDAAIVVFGAWLIAEFLGGVAVRHVVVGRRSATGALAGAVAEIVRRPVTSAATYLLGVAGVAGAALPTLLLSAALWSRLQAFLADDMSLLLLLPATFVFVLVWTGGLAAVGVVTAWRSLAGTLDVLRHGGAAVAVEVPPVADPPLPEVPATVGVTGVAAAAPEVVLLEG